MHYDVIVIGGALAGAAAATLLRRENPDLRVLIIEKSPHFTRRVGEATVEVSGYFLGRVLGLTRFMNDTQLVKQGMRFWFANDQTTSLADSSEIGPKYMVRVPSFQLDRAVFDEEVLRRAIEQGVEIRRPASVTKVELQSGGLQTVQFRSNGAHETATARWVVDASGVAALLSRQNGWLTPNREHPIAAVWARWTGVKDMDGPDLAAKFPDWSAQCYGIRATATNHIVGEGWWSWWIPLKGGDFSVGVVYDQRLVHFPADGANNGDRLKNFLLQHPVARELLADASPVEGDVHSRKDLPYSSTTYAGDGFALAGDAAAFLDPFYSPGMDWLSFTTTAISKLIAAERRGEPLVPLLEKHNQDFSQSYERWFTAIYKDKYHYMGDYELMRLAFLLDLGLYYFGIVSQPFKRGAASLSEPPFSTPPSTPPYHFIRTYNRRLAAIAQERKRCGTWGRRNTGEKFFFGGFLLCQSNFAIIAGATLQWLRLEITEGWRTWFRSAERLPAIPPATAREDFRPAVQPATAAQNLPRPVEMLAGTGSSK